MSEKIKFNLDHTMIRVADLEKSLDFYIRIMGMKILRKNEYPDGRFTNVFIGYGPENKTTTIEITNNWDIKTPYDKGEAYGHIAFNVEDVLAAMKYLEAEGVIIKSPAKSMNHGTRMLGFVFDPDGYIIELNEPLNS
ncbi:lactoylglutathione lyase [Amphritea sp.]|uniref:lactoylglutathione lyase n=1 Tax=Amphritea sp. TaxID=1872502 RepID=UPI0025B91732|nr:lactoylglutathione lyase [Amphritea sp.]